MTKSWIDTSTECLVWLQLDIRWPLLFAVWIPGHSTKVGPVDKVEFRIDTPGGFGLGDSFMRSFC